MQTAVLVRLAGTKATVTGGLAVIAAGLWQISTATAASTYTDTLVGVVRLGMGAGRASRP